MKKRTLTAALFGLALMNTVALAKAPVYSDNMDVCTGWTAFFGPKSTVAVESDKKTKAESAASLKWTFSVTDWGGIGKEFKPRLAWSAKDSLSFQIKGDGKFHKLSVEITDNGGERFNKQFVVDKAGWQTIVVPIKEFVRRKDWQPDKAPANGLTLTKVEGVSFSVDGLGKGVVNIDSLEVGK